MKLGCTVGAFAHPHYEPPYEEAIQRIADLGFEGVELMVYREEDFQAYYTPSRVKQLRRMMADRGLALSELILYSSFVQGLADRDPAPRRRSFELIERGIELARALGTGIINMVSSWPAELRAPASYFPSFIHPSVSGPGAFDPVLNMEIPVGFDATGLWERYMESLGHVVSLMEGTAVSLAIEGHANVILGTTDGMLRAFDRIPSRSFGANFDTSWQLMQRESLPWSVYKLGNRILNVHARDGDGLVCYSLPPGRGIVDWNGFIRALRSVGYDGFLSIEIADYARPERYLREAKGYLERVMEEEGV
jgi:sugar phosphate isomerase/epimerase